MCRISVTVLLAVAVAAAQGVPLQQDPDLHQILQEVIGEVKEKFGKNDHITVDDFDENFYVVTLSMMDLELGNLNTIQTVGGDSEQTITKSEADGNTVYDFAVTLGLEDLYMSGRMNYYALAGWKSGAIKFKLTGTGQAVKVYGSVRVNSTGCSAGIDRATFQNTGTFRVTMTEKNYNEYAGLAASIAQFGLNVFLPIFRYFNMLDRYVTYEALVLSKKGFSELACKPFITT